MSGIAEQEGYAFPWSEWDAENLESLSLAWEVASGADSIPTIERVYDRSDGGAYICCYPDCDFKRRSAVALWSHIHRSHGAPSLPPADFDPGPWL